jgi:Family of unknown function (DUF6152)
MNDAVNGLRTELHSQRQGSPHVRLYMEVRNASKPVIWELYLGSPNQQIMNGWRIDTYRRGDHVSVGAYPAKDGSSVGFAGK